MVQKTATSVRFGRAARMCAGAAMVLSVCFLRVTAAYAQIESWKGFPEPDKDELAMTSFPGQPGAPAVVLDRQEIDDNERNFESVYERVKVLTEKGKDAADVQLRFVDQGTGWFEESNVWNVDVEGRTIHPDGTIIPFKGKPYVKTVWKNDLFKAKEVVFSMPDVEVGSIIEYHYVQRESDGFVSAPRWYVQGPYFVKKAHYKWYPTTRMLMGSNGAPVDHIAWFPLLPAGAQVQRQELANGGEMSTMHLPNQSFTLDIKDVPPQPKENLMPPMQSFSYRVLFSFTEYGNADQYWQGAGKQWSKAVDSFEDVNGDLRQTADSIVAGATTPEEKLQKLYAAVEALENTRFTREHERLEDKTNGLAKVKHARDILANKRGTPTEITETFIALARAAGLKAYAMRVPDASETLFIKSWLEIDQLDSLIAVVNVDGKDEFFDPGERDCAFGHLAWQHTFMDGLRQTDEGTAFSKTSGDGYTANRMQRIANLTMDPSGAIHGTVDMTFMGAEALDWRQMALANDDEEVRTRLRKRLERYLPSSLEVKVNSIDHIDDYERPLIVHYDVRGTVGTLSGNRIVVPAELFAASDEAMFPEQKRDLPVWFNYANIVQDAIRINLPNTIKVEAQPNNVKTLFGTRAEFTLNSVATDNSVTVRGNLALGDFAIPVKDYGDFRTFYAQLQANDREPILLKSSAPLQAVVPAAGDSVAHTDSGTGVD